MLILYLFLIAFAIASVVVYMYSKKKISECQSDKERRAVKAKWQLISGLLGLACIIMAAVLIFTMF